LVSQYHNIVEITTPADLDLIGLMYNLFLAYPISFIGERHWDTVQAGLPLISVLIGTILGGVIISCTTHTWLGGRHEARLPLMMLGAVCLPVGILWFAATCSPDSHPNPWPQIVAGVPIGLGIQLINMQGMNYIVDCYGINANSAMAAVTCMRSLFASGFPVFAKAIYAALGVPVATTVLAGFGAILAPVPVLFYCFGERIRAKCAWTPT
jgi:MFS transporter, DHA1 family, multidrug resistance protein